MPEDVWRVLASTNEWVRYSDAKAAGALAGAGVLAGALASAGLSDKIDGAPALVVLLGVVSGIGAFVAAAFALYALVPTLKVGEPTSLIYFDHTVRQYENDPTGYTSALRSMVNDQDRLFEQVASQIWANSKVARKKFRASGWALSALAAGVLFGAAAAISSFI